MLGDCAGLEGALESPDIEINAQVQSGNDSNLDDAFKRQEIYGADCLRFTFYGSLCLDDNQFMISTELTERLEEEGLLENLLGCTALDIALECGHIDVAWRLIEAGGARSGSKPIPEVGLCMERTNRTVLLESFNLVRDGRAVAVGANASFMRRMAQLPDNLLGVILPLGCALPACDS